MKFPSVLGVSRAPKAGAVEAYRLVYPLHKMNLMGHDSGVVRASDLAAALEDGRNIAAKYDVVHFHGMIGTDEEANNIREAGLLLRAMGCTVLVDYDDDYTNTHREVHEATLVGLDAFSGITTSTPYLKDVMKPHNRNIRVLKNLIVPEMFEGFKRLIPGKVIGLTGSTTHHKDWEIVIDPLFAVAKKYPDVKVFCSGMVPERLYDLGDQLITIRKLFPKTAEEHDNDNFFIPLHEYGGILTNIDILLAPVDPSDRFNWSKSNLKAIEGQTAGCVVIATGDVPNYQDAITHGRTGFLVPHTDQDAWFSTIERLINDVELCRNVRDAGRASALRNFNIHSGIRERVATYLDFIELDRKSRTKIRASVAAMVSSTFAEAKVQE